MSEPGTSPDSAGPGAASGASFPAGAASARGPAAGVGALLPDTLDCVHCGLCLSSCPTYRETGRETSSPRGRIYLFRGLAEGQVPLGDLVDEEAALCLGCRACETACPAGVSYGRLLEDTRALLEREGRRTGWVRGLERAALRGLVPRRRRLRLAMDALGWVQRLGLDRMALPFLPARLRAMHALLPAVPARADRAPLPRRSARRVGEAAAGASRSSSGCIMP